MTLVFGNDFTNTDRCSVDVPLEARPCSFSILKHLAVVGEVSLHLIEAGDFLVNAFQLGLKVLDFPYKIAVLGFQIGFLILELVGEIRTVSFGRLWAHGAG